MTDEKSFANCFRCSKPLSDPFDAYFVAYVGFHHGACLPSPAHVHYYAMGLQWAREVAERAALDNGAAGAPAQVVANMISRQISLLNGGLPPGDPVRPPGESAYESADKARAAAGSAR